MIFDNTITRQDFEKSLKLKDLESFTDVQVEQWTKDAKELLEKSTKEELNDIEKSQLEEFMVCAPNLGKVTVVNDDLTKSLMYYRPSQVEWEVSEEVEIMKSRAGTYKDTHENRKLGRVGQKFGESKKEEESSLSNKEANGAFKIPGHLS